MRRASLVAWAVLTVLGIPPAHGQAPSITYPAGSYTLTFPTPVQIVTTGNSVTFSWAVSPTPTPTPIPIPPPAPAPVPVLSGHIWALAIYDATKPAPTVAASPTLKASALALDVEWQPRANTDPAIVSWIPHVPTSGLPALLLAQADGTGHGVVGYAAPLPASEAGALALLQQVRGGKR